MLLKKQRAQFVGCLFPQTPRRRMFSRRNRLTQIPNFEKLNQTQRKSHKRRKQCKAEIKQG